MCDFFSFCTEPEGHGGKRYYFDWEARKSRGMDEGCDSHSVICKTFLLNEDKCNKYEYNPITKIFIVDQINSPIDDRVQAEEWVNNLDFKRIVEPLMIKPIINPFDLPMVEIVTEEHIRLLKEWDSVGASVRASVWDSVGASVRASVRDSVWDSVGASVGASVWASVRDSVRDSVWDSVWDSVRDSVWAYISSFFDIKYGFDYSAAIKLWDMGIVPSFDGTKWRLHSGKNADVIFKISKEQLGEVRNE